MLLVREVALKDIANDKIYALTNFGFVLVWKRSKLEIWLPIR